MPAKLTRNSIVVVGPNQVSADLSPNIAGEVVILDINGGTYYELSDVGARVWELVQHPASLQSIIDKLLDEYSVDEERCEADLIALVQDMAARGLIEIRDGPNR